MSPLLLLAPVELAFGSAALLVYLCRGQAALAAR